MSEAEITDLALVDETSALAVLQDPEKFDAFYERVKAQTDTLVPDLTTVRGRKEIASMARRVVKTKTFIDAQRKVLTEDARKVIDAADRAGKLIRDRLDALRDDVRRPLTEWEAEEDIRVAKVSEILAELRSASVVSIEDTSGALELRILRLSEMTFSDLGAQADGLDELRNSAVRALTEGRVRALKAEDDARELAALRAQEAERERLEEEARLEAERAQTAQLEAVRREEARLAEIAQQEQAERDRIERERIAAERTAESAREEERLRLAAIHQAEVEAERQARLAAQEETRKLEEAEAERQRISREEAAASESRLKDRAHKSAVMSAAKQALIGILPPDLPYMDEVAITIVRAIVAGEIPNISISF